MEALSEFSTVSCRRQWQCGHVFTSWHKSRYWLWEGSFLELPLLFPERHSHLMAVSPSLFYDLHKHKMCRNAITSFLIYSKHLLGFAVSLYQLSSDIHQTGTLQCLLCRTNADRSRRQNNPLQFWPHFCSNPLLCSVHRSEFPPSGEACLYLSSNLEERQLMLERW